MADWQSAPHSLDVNPFVATKVHWETRRSFRITPKRVNRDLFASFCIALVLPNPFEEYVPKSWLARQGKIFFILIQNTVSIVEDDTSPCFDFFQRIHTSQDTNWVGLRRTATGYDGHIGVDDVRIRDWLLI